MQYRILDKNFFNRPAEKVAKELLGKFLVRGFTARRTTRTGRRHARKVAIMITEVEAYVGPQDKASHASRGRTARNEPMWGEAGRFYVYFTYGMHWMLNVVTGKSGYPAAVIIRGGIMVENGEPRPRSGRAAVLMRGAIKSHGSRVGGHELINGPARLTKFLKIDKRFNGLPANKRTGLWLEDRGRKIKPSHIKRGPRIGVDYAGRWTKKPYNFKLKELRN